ncbi:hypothetical protein [Pseudomonas sp. KNUC1026]|uniref:hypothetical protein n=1 Tax=Pseudomonas sp. KNUC1026 TaxID=2893890 RepID=UPI001F25757B|nr:hypothetical protein [Pseudomonas sp. KNUC1026]UFH49592.1 hypothetical protein LN139_22865 [Pseudomonas sp. KNUC1026]
MDKENIPADVKRAACIEWGVLIDGYLTNAARVGSRLTATLFLDCARLIRNGETVVTPPVRKLTSRGDFCLVQSESGNDHYVIVSELASLRLQSV